VIVIAIVLAAVAVVIALISLTAAGTLAVRLRVVAPRPDRPGPDAAALLPASIPTLGRSVADVLGPLVDVTVATRDGPTVMTDSYLSDDGCVLFVSSACGVCRYLVRESGDVLAARPVRVLVVAPTIERGIEFMTNDCHGAGFGYQVDPAGERARALGVKEFPSVLVIADGVITAAYIVSTAAQLWQVPGPADGPSRADGQNGAERVIEQGTRDGR
jgi:hypothetical protein